MTALSALRVLSRRLRCQLCASVLFLQLFLCALLQNWLGQFLDRLNRFWAVWPAAAAAPFLLLSPLLLLSLLSFLPSRRLSLLVFSHSLTSKSLQYPLKSLQKSWKKVEDLLLSSPSASSPFLFEIFVDNFIDRGNYISSLFFDSFLAFLEIS